MKLSSTSKFIPLILLVELARSVTADSIWKRAGERLIDLNKIPSPENSIELNQGNNFEPKVSTEISSVFKPKHRSTLQKLKQAYNNRSELDETERKEIENNLQNYRIKRRLQQSRRKKAMWKRIRAGEGTESDLRAKASARKSHDKWIKANQEQEKVLNTNGQIWKRSGDGLIDLNRTPSPDISDGEGTKKVNSTTSSKPKQVRKRKRGSMTIEEKREKEALRARTNYHKQKMEYENRFQFPEGSEKRKKIEDDYQTMIKRKTGYHVKRTKELYARLRAGTATEQDRIKLQKLRKSKKRYYRNHSEKAILYARQRRLTKKLEKADKSHLPGTD